MLKINKILSKKIKYPLSLRGLFPFCHSRESGNPSSISFRGAKQRSNLDINGFTLIELMIAAVILALAVLGIFLAFSNAWMGMANARDRTVATNYAREAMEDVKNMDFELVTNENLGTAESVGAKFTRVIIVNTESDNLKKIDTKVFWTNRQGQYVSVEPSMYINRTIFNPGEATKIVLYANPYYSVLPSATETIDLIAVIKDESGNTKIDWSGGNIRFTIISGSELGSLPAGAGGGVDTNDGIAQTIFTPSNILDEFEFPQQGDVEIEAAVELPSDGSTISDIITITVTLGVVRVELSADPYSIDADGTSTSTLTATLVDAAGGKVENAPNDILFAISGEGIFVDSSSGGSPLGDTELMPNSSGIAIIYVESIDNTPGVATVTASSGGLLSGTVDIITTGLATSIDVSVEPDLIYINDTDGARVIVEIQDINGNPVEFTGEISLTASDGTVPSSLNFAATSLAETTFSPATASPGTVNITASRLGLTTGSTTIEVQAALVADTISLSAIPKNILAGGGINSIITATIKDGSTVINNYSNDVIFEIFSDTSSSNDANLLYNGFEYGIDALPPLTVLGVDVDHGEAVVGLEPGSDVGICTIKVSTVNSLGATIANTVKVGFYSSEDHIELKAFPSKMLVEGDTCKITATVVDEGGIPVVNYDEDISFTILVGWPKNVKFAATGTSSLTTTLTGGDIDIYLIPQGAAGTVTLKASSFTGMTDITGYLNIQVISALTDLELALEPNIDYGGNQVSFDINVQGADLFLNEMQVSWSTDDSETLNKIEIKSPSTASSTIIFDNIGEPASSGELINVEDIALWAGISNVKLYFNESMSGKTLEVIFNATSGNYPVEISELLIE